MTLKETFIGSLGPQCRTVIIALKCAAEMMEKHPYPSEFLEFIFKKTVGCPDAENKLSDYLITWAVAACHTTNQKSRKTLSQVRLQLPDMDMVNDSIDNWAEARLDNNSPLWRDVFYVL